jgi:hypothetical protein
MMPSRIKRWPATSSLIGLPRTAAGDSNVSDESGSAMARSEAMLEEVRERVKQKRDREQYD